MIVAFNRPSLEALYLHYNRRELIHPDPLEFVHRYAEPVDREVVGLVAACLAYGRVRQILKSVSGVLDRLGPSPGRFLLGHSREEIDSALKDFRHRFTDGRELSALLGGVRDALLGFGSLEACFLSGCRSGDETVLQGLEHFCRRLRCACPDELTGILLPRPVKGSACKRLHLFLRWMARKDDVDPGVWDGLSPSRLIVPLDTHMFRIARALGLTRRKQADLRAALEITEAFRALSPEDPVKYDFALTRLGIRDGVDISEVL
ncbi:MAG: TIGR02757 family protein [Syntrophobacteraceae bacterium]|jgi:uncharacterized protein (TIGR02757 family)|nr:TIGR02757 family protein [Syntrophobacteraceae bacterium]